jgi:anti-sigma regulatory factor (Ser/Thr protein kinase)
VTLLLNGEPTTLSDARRTVSSRFPAEIADNAALVLSELTTNAIQYALPGDVRVIAQQDRYGARVIVVDPGPNPFEVLDPERPDDQRGWGLNLVDELSDRTGEWNTPTGHHAVWAAWDAR